MRALPRDVRYGAFGALAGAAALAAGRCGGGACLSCFACALPGAAAVLLAAFGRSAPASRSLPDREPRARGAPEALAARPRPGGPKGSSPDLGLAGDLR